MTGKAPRSRSEPLAVSAALDQLAAEAWVVDVSDWGSPVERDVLHRIGDPAMVCSGSHGPGPCPIGVEPGDGRHDVTFEVVAGRVADANYVARFKELVGDGTRVATRHRRPGDPGAQRDAAARSAAPINQEETR